ncbi:MAG: J domain-containing protein [Epsilonproteobacteria bacterium]|nr:J domain-containing protein [Campylobacterota bacterium]
MEIVLQNNLILVRTDFDTLNQEWMIEFLNHHAKSMLFLPKSVLIFRNDTLKEIREEFIKALSHHHAKTHDFDHEFFLKALLKFSNYPIKIELDKLNNPEIVKVNLYAYDKHNVLISLDKPNKWVMTYFRSQLNVYMERGTDESMVLDLSTYKAKSRFDRAMGKKHILHYDIQYTYDNRFLSTLYSDFASYSFGDLVKDNEIDENLKYYTILEVPVGASKDVLRQSYKKLVKIYHPDKIIAEEPYMVDYYTQKFQLLQEAYNTLRIVS